MRIALIAPPFIPVPPTRYGGTELFIAQLAGGLASRGHEVVLYANGESVAPPGATLRALYPRSEWPLDRPDDAPVKDLAHTAWAFEDAAGSSDVLHVNSVPGVVLSRFVDVPVVATLHHPHNETISSVFAQYPEVHYVGISRAQLDQESLVRETVVHHGLDLDLYPFEARKGDDLVFLGRIAPEKAPHLAIEVARRAGRKLLIAGEVQPIYRDYWETAVKPFVDGRHVEFVGEVGLAEKVALLGRAAAMLFPIEWEEPFGLVMLEAMACGTPVLAFGRGSVPEVVVNGVSGWVCADVADMVRKAVDLGISPQACRRHVASRFTLDHMVSGYERVYRETRGTRTEAQRANSSCSIAQN